MRTFRIPAPARRLALGVALLAAAATSGASHSWGGYHWARTAYPFTVMLGDNVSSAWDSVLVTTSSDWSASSVLTTAIYQGTSNPKNCRPVAGRVQVCNAKYGNTGWLGVAQIWVTGSVHITQGTVKLNDTYFGTATYNTPAWRNLVSCQEVGHTFGLAHQDENFNNANLDSCMDYTSNPESNQHPNQHDYDELATIYAHADTTTTLNSITAMPSAMQGRDFDRPSSWGQSVRRSRSGAQETFVRDFGHGFKLVTHVFWALEEGGPAHRQQRANED